MLNKNETRMIFIARLRQLADALETKQAKILDGRLLLEYHFTEEIELRLQHKDSPPPFPSLEEIRKRCKDDKKE